MNQKEIIPWSDFLNMLDGSPLHIATPKSTNPQDIVWKRKQPIFATGPEKIKKYHKGTHALNDGETNQMNARWQYVELTHTIEETNNALMPCGVCFAKLILED